MPEMEGVDNLEQGAIETQQPQSEEQADNSQEETIAPDPKETRHAQQLAGSKQEVERFKSLLVDSTFNDIVEEKKDVSTLRELYNRDEAGKKVAESVAEKFDREGSKRGTFANFLAGKEIGSGINTKQLSDDDIDKLVDAREAKREHEKALDKIEKGIKKVPQEQQEEVQAYIDKFSKGLQLDSDTATTLLESAILYVNKDKLKKDRKDDAIKSLASSGIQGGATNLKSDDLIVDGMIRKNGKRVQA